MKFKHFAMTAIAVFAMAPARADRTYSGGSIADTTWTTGEVVTITGTATIAGSVVAEPGVTVVLSDGVQVTVEPGGSFTANGTAEAPVLFRPATSFWGRLQVTPGATLTLNHVNVHRARRAIDSYQGTVTLRHCLITDIIGADGADGVPAAPPASNGGTGDSVTAILSAGGTNLVITDTVIDGIYGGNGGDGAMPDPGSGIPLSGAGGNGGSALAVGRYDATPATFVFERNIIANVRSGSGGMGADGIPGGNGGDGGSGSSSHGIEIVFPADAYTFSNCVFYRIVSQQAGPGGLAGGGGGSAFDGAPGFPGNSTAVFGVAANLELRHFTFDSIGDEHGSKGAAVESVPSATGGLIRLVNSAVSNVYGTTAYGLWSAAPSTAEADTCNFFNDPALVNLGTLVSSVSLDPAFIVGPGLDDFHLTAGSPLIDIGKSTATIDDLDGHIRDAMPDIGAYEFSDGYNGRGFGDFDNSHCTDINDFLFLLDYWQIDVGGEEIGIPDFLALLDNWMLGTGC